MTPIIADAAVPPGTIYALPSDVLNAIYRTEQAARDACTWFGLYLFAPILFPDYWRYISPALETATRRAINDLDNHILSAQRIIAQAASEKRIGCITNIGEPK